MKKLKEIMLNLLLFIVLSIMGVLVLYLFDRILNLNFENLWYEGYKVGFIAYFILLGYYLMTKLKKSDTKQMKH